MTKKSRNVFDISPYDLFLVGCSGNESVPDYYKSAIVKDLETFLEKTEREETESRKFYSFVRGLAKFYLSFSDHIEDGELKKSLVDKARSVLSFVDDRMPSLFERAKRIFRDAIGSLGSGKEVSIKDIRDLGITMLDLRNEVLFAHVEFLKNYDEMIEAAKALEEVSGTGSETIN